MAKNFAQKCVLPTQNQNDRSDLIISVGFDKFWIFVDFMLSFNEDHVKRPKTSETSQFSLKV